MTKLVELFGGRKKSIILFCSSHIAVFYISYSNTTHVCWLDIGKESSHIRIFYYPFKFPQKTKYFTYFYTTEFFPLFENGQIQGKTQCLLFVEIMKSWCDQHSVLSSTEHIFSLWQTQSW